MGDARRCLLSRRRFPLRCRRGDRSEFLLLTLGRGLDSLVFRDRFCGVLFLGVFTFPRSDEVLRVFRDRSRSDLSVGRRWGFLRVRRSRDRDPFLFTSNRLAGGRVKSIPPVEIHAHPTVH